MGRQIGIREDRETGMKTDDRRGIEDTNSETD